MPRPIRTSYHPLSVLFHWFVAALVITGATLGILGTQVITDKAVLGPLFKTHKTIGLTVFFLTFIRLATRLTYEMAPAQISHIENVLSRMGHVALYIMAILVPLSGYAVSNAHGHPVFWFQVPLPTLVEKSKNLGELFDQVHFFCAYFFIALFLGHGLFAVKHFLFDKVNLFKRMSWKKS